MATPSMPSILLVHGAWHGAWCFAPLIAALEQRHEGALAIDLPGHGERQGEKATWDGYVSAVVEALERFEAPPLVVGHSMGGAVITAAAQTAPSRIGGLAYLCAFLPADGESVLQLSQQGAAIEGVIVDPVAGVATVPREAAVRSFYHDVESAEGWLDLLQPEPLEPTAQPVTVTSEKWGSTPRAYILCSQDRAISPSLQAQMADRAAPMARFEMAYGHSPFLAAPMELASLLLDVRDAILHKKTG